MTTEQCISNLKSIAQRDINNPALLRITLQMLDCPKFALAPAASTSQSPHAHHAYTGGLVQHTYEVVQQAIGIAYWSLKPVSMEVVVTAAIWHDYMKIKQYVQDTAGDWVKTPYCKEHYHVAGSYAEFMIAASKEPQITTQLVNDIGHCILAHHGHNPAWGSPVAPITREAYIIHAADMLSSQY